MKKKLSRILAIVLVVCCLASIGVTASAATVEVDSTHSVTVNKGSSTSKTYTLSAVWHDYGSNTVVSLSSFTSAWTASLPSAAYRVAFYSAAASEGLNRSKTYSPGSYTIGSGKTAGTYEIRATVSGYTGSWYVSQYSSTQSEPISVQSVSPMSTVESGSISFSPTASSVTIAAVWVSSTPIS